MLLNDKYNVQLRLFVCLCLCLTALRFKVRTSTYFAGAHNKHPLILAPIWQYALYSTEEGGGACDYRAHARRSAPRPMEAAECRRARSEATHKPSALRRSRSHTAAPYSLLVVTTGERESKAGQGKALRGFHIKH